MKFEGPAAIDTIIFMAAAFVSLVCIVHIAMRWSLRRNFFIVLRSPRLTCALGLSSSLSYLCLMYALVANSTDVSAKQVNIAHLLSFPAMLIAMVALIMIAIRLLVMYFPSERVVWGRFTKEVPLTYGLIFLFVSMEIAVWSAAWSSGLASVAAVVKSLRPWSAFVTVIASVGLVSRLRRVDDASNIGHDVRMVGGFLLGIVALQAVFAIAPMSFVAQKYARIGLHFVSNPFINWVWRSKAEVLFVAPLRRSSSSIVAVTYNSNYKLSHAGSSVDANQLVSIMRFLPLREAFGEFCRRSLCSESFQFLLDVAEYQSDGSVDGTGNKEEKKGFRGFGSYFAIVNDYIKDGSHSEINIDFPTKRDIMKYSKFKAYSSLDSVGRKEIFSTAKREIEKILEDNLVTKFLVSDQYKAVVDFEEVIPR